MFFKTQDCPLVSYLDFQFYSQVDFGPSLGSYKLYLKVRYVFKVNLAAISLPRIELRLICFVISEITNVLL